MVRQFAALRPNSMVARSEPATTSCFAASVALLRLARGFASQWRPSPTGSLPRARGRRVQVPLLSHGGVSQAPQPCPELEAPSGVNPSRSGFPVWQCPGPGPGPGPVVPLLSGVTPCLELEVRPCPSGAGESKSQASAPSGNSPCQCPTGKLDSEPPAGGLQIMAVISPLTVTTTQQI